MKKWSVGIDLGGTKIEVAIIDQEGKVHDRIRVKTETAKSATAVIQSIIGITNDILKKHPDIHPIAIGIGVAGQIEKETGNVIYAPNLRWHNVKLQQELSKGFNIPVIVSNDVRAAMWGEWKYGSGIGCNELVCVFIGTGIGGGIVSNGKIVEGCNNTAGEIGHITIDIHGPLCHCGNKGCFEALAGGWAIARDVKYAVQHDLDAGKIILELADGDIDNITAETLAKAAEKSDTLANKLIDDLSEAMIAGITSVVNMTGPCRVILGGGIIVGMPQLTERIEKGVKQRALKTALTSLEILSAKLVNDSGVVGAASLALHSLELHNHKQNDH